MPNTCIVASAGSGKTHQLVARASEHKGRCLLTTYTVKNTAEISARMLHQQNGTQDVSTWFSFVLTHCIRPYQARLFSPNYVKGIRLDEFRAPQRARRRDAVRYFTDGNGYLIKDRIADLAISLNEASGGAVMRRLESIYSHIYIDELQDFSGTHLDLLDLLIDSSIEVTVCGDPRQSTFTVSRENRNRGYRGAAMMRWLEERTANGGLVMQTLPENHRSNQQICDFADSLYPDFPTTTSSQTSTESRNHHIGVFTVSCEDRDRYLAEVRPQVLVWDVRAARKLGIDGTLNFGQVKGLAFDDVFVVLTQTMEQSLPTMDDLAAQARAKLYVGITRARHSVGLLMSDTARLPSVRRYTGTEGCEA